MNKTNDKLKKLNDQKRGLKLGPKFKGLTDKQRAFINQYTIHWNAQKAAKDVGYRGKNTANKLIDGKSFPLVTAAIKEIQSRQEEEGNVSRSEIKKELSNYIRLDIVEIFSKGWFVVEDPEKIPPNVRRCIKDIEVSGWTDENGDQHQTVKVKLIDKLKATDMMMKHLGMYAPDKHEVTVGLDWDSLYNAGSPEEEQDIIEAAIQQAALPKE